MALHRLDSLVPEVMAWLPDGAHLFYTAHACIAQERDILRLLAARPETARSLFRKLLRSEPFIWGWLGDDAERVKLNAALTSLRDLDLVRLDGRRWNVTPAGRALASADESHP